MTVEVEICQVEKNLKHCSKQSWKGQANAETACLAGNSPFFM